jgi:ribosomal protein S18
MNKNALSKYLSEIGRAGAKKRWANATKKQREQVGKDLKKARQEKAVDKIKEPA